MPRIVVPIPRTEQPQQHVKIAQGWAGRIPNAMIQSLDMSVDESPIVTIGTVGRLVNAGGVMTTHSSAAVNFQRTKFRNPYASGNGVGMWLLIQFSTTTTGQSDKIICSLGSDSGGVGNTIFAGNLTTTNTFRSLHGGSSATISAWQDSGVVITDGKPHTALMYTATSPSGATVFYKGFLDGKKYVDSSEAKVIGNLAYTYLCAGGVRRTTDLAGFTGNVGLVACILDDMPDALAESLTRNPWQIYKDEEFPVWFSAATGVSLVIADVAHAHSLDAVSFTQAHNLAQADITHGHTLDAVSLTQTHNLVQADIAHAHTLDNVVLNVDVTLSVADVVHGHSLETIALSQTHNLTQADVSHAHVVDAASFTQVHNLAQADLVHAHTAEAVTLTVGGITLSLDIVLHAHTLDNVNLTQTHSLSLANVAHAHALDNLIFTFDGVQLSAPRSMYSNSQASRRSNKQTARRP